MGANTEICMRIKNVNMYIQFRCEIKPIPESEQEKYHIQYVTPPHEPDHWRPTINADVHRRVVPGTQNSQGKGVWEVVEVLVASVCCLASGSAAP